MTRKSPPKSLIVMVAVTAFSLATPAAAHPLHGAGFAAGWVHPLLGLDHLLAMLAVGLWAAQLGGRWLWAAPLAFISGMLAGGLLGLGAITMPLTSAAIDPVIAASVLMLGLVIAANVRASASLRAAGTGLIALFAVFHGVVHAAEVPGQLAAAAYVAGFVFATAALLALGMAAGLGMRPKAVRVAGVPIALAGAWLMVVAS